VRSARTRCVGTSLHFLEKAKGGEKGRRNGSSGEERKAKKTRIISKKN